MFLRTPTCGHISSCPDIPFLAILFLMYTSYTTSEDTMTGEPHLLSERERVIEAVTTLFVNIDNRDWIAARSCFTERVEDIF